MKKASKKSKAKKSAKSAIAKARKAIKNFSAATAVRMFKAGKSISKIAQHFGYPQGSGQNRVRYALDKAGAL